MSIASNAPRKIVHVNQYGSFKGGVENYIYEIAEAMREYEHYLIYSCDANQDYLKVFKGSHEILGAQDIAIEDTIRNLAPNHLIVYNIGYKSMEVFFRLRDLLGFKIMKSFHDHSMFYVGPGYNRLTLKRIERPLSWYSIFGCLTRDAFTRKIGFENVFRKRRLLAEVNRADAIEIHTEEMGRLLSKNGIRVDMSYINPPWAKDPGPGNPVPEKGSILFAGSLIRGKGLTLLLKALKKVKVTYRLKVAGDGYQRQALERYAVRYKIPVTFLGRVPKKELSDLYRSCSFVVMPSILEGFGFVTVEAMSHSRPAIAFDVGGVSEIIKDGANGYLVRPFDLDELAARIEELLREPEKAAVMGTEGRKIFLSKFAFERHLARLREKLSELEG